MLQGGTECLRSRDNATIVIITIVTMATGCSGRGLALTVRRSFFCIVMRTYAFLLPFIQVASLTVLVLALQFRCMVTATYQGPGVRSRGQQRLRPSLQEGYPL